MLWLTTLLELFRIISILRISSREAEDNNPGGDIQGAARQMLDSSEMFGRGYPIRKSPGSLAVEMREAINCSSCATNAISSNRGGRAGEDW